VRLDLFILVTSLACSVTFGQDHRPNLNAARLRTGSFRYRTLVDRKEAGQSQIGIRRSAGTGNYVYSNVITGAFSQSWEAIATPAFAPVSAKLTSGQGNEARPVFELSYRGERVSGFAVSGTTQPLARMTVDETVAADTVDQRIDWAAVMALKDYAPDQEYTFHVYDPGTGNSRVIVTVGPTEITRVPAGAFETIRVVYRIEKNRGPEVYQVLVSKQARRFMVKEEFPNGAVTELLEVKP
jgi:hypothetical protein